MREATRLQWSLLSLRVSVFIVMLMWTLDKLIQPEHSTKVFETFYGLAGLGSTIFMIIGLIELLLILAFVAGVYKRFTYGVVLLIHGVSTFSSFQQYLDPFNNLLFFAAWPMLAACVSLYLLRDDDTLFAYKQTLD
ncbi:MAG: hypothetical protein P1P93_05275 [Gammaproteobacteria bacterium]|nr:hypothetical protein [Gammaproteobacteria bacterium]